MDVSEYFFLITFIVLGAFSVVAAVFNIEWYFQTSGAALFVRRWGRKGARIFYALLGAALIACGVLGLIYWR